VHVFANFFGNSNIIEIQGRDTALLLLVNPCIPHQKNGTTYPSYINYCPKKRHFVAHYVQPIIQLYKSMKRTSAATYENYGQFPLQMEVITCLPQNRHFFVVSKDE